MKNSSSTIHIDRKREPDAQKNRRNWTGGVYRHPERNEVFDRMTFLRVLTYEKPYIVLYLTGFLILAAVLFTDRNSGWAWGTFLYALCPHSNGIKRPPIPPLIRGLEALSALFGSFSKLAFPKVNYTTKQFESHPFSVKNRH